MRCTKCSYISFDYNLVCPKCNKDLQEIQSRLNLPNYKPSPPFLLGMLIGEANDSHLNLNVPLPAHMEDAAPDDFNLDISEEAVSDELTPEADEEELDLLFEEEELDVSGVIDEPEVIPELPEIETSATGLEEPVIGPSLKAGKIPGKEKTSGQEGPEIESTADELLTLNKDRREVQASVLDLQFEELSVDEEPLSQAPLEDKPLDLELEGIAFDLEDISADLELEEGMADLDLNTDSPGQKDNDELLLDLDDLITYETDKPIKPEKTFYDESEMETMEINKQKMNPSDDKKDTD